MRGQIRNDACRTMVVCVDSYNRGNPCGRFYNYGQSGDEFEFQSLTELIVGIENILDSANFPQSFTAIRSFAAVPEPELKRQEGYQAWQGEQATFTVKILFRQHTSWQGTITWLEQKSEQSFRSVLELILLMDSALNSAEKD